MTNEISNTPNDENEKIKSLFLKDFEYKDEYNWKALSMVKDDDKYKRCMLYGERDNDNVKLYVKNLNFNIEDNRIDILKEIYFLILLKNHKYFVNLDKIVLSDYLLLIFKGDHVSLDRMIIFQENNYFKNIELFKFIIYQITIGLNYLHKNGIIHNDVKDSNILIGKKGDILICDMGSMDYKDKKSKSYTKYYVAPEFFNNYNRDEKSDLWGLGIIILKMFLRKNDYFNLENKIGIQTQFHEFLLKIGIKEIYKKKDIKSILNNNNNSINLNMIKYDEITKIIKDEKEKDKEDNRNIIDLIKNLIVLNPYNRYDVDKILNSKFLGGGGEENDNGENNLEKDSIYDKISEIKNIKDFKDFIEANLKPLLEIKKNIK